MIDVEVIYLKIEQTTDYKQFKNIQGNRAINEAHVAFLIQSIGIRNLLQYAPIIVNEKMEIIDGQHRLKAAEQMSLTIYYMQVKGATIREVQLLNATNRSWKMEDFLEAYVTEGLPEYVAVREFMTRHSFRLGATLLILSKKIRNRGGKNITNDFKAGVFVRDDPDWSEQVAVFMNTFRPFIHDNVRGDKHFIQAMLIIFDKKAELKHLVGRAQKQAVRLERQTSTKNYLKELERTYNFDMNTNIVRFF